MDEGRILATARADIRRADDYYKDYIEQDLLRRYEVYYSSRERYKKLYPRLSEKNDMRTFDVWSTIEWLLPDLLKSFFGSNRIISISGVGSEDAERAERIMKLIQWQLTVKNTGYRVFKNWFADALASNLGILKCHWKRETKQARHEGVFDEAQLVGILSDRRNRVISSEPVPDMMSALGLASPRVSLAWETTEVTVNEPVIEVVRPSDIRFTPDGRTLPECSMVAHRKMMTIDQLRRDARRGLYESEVVEALADDASDEPEASELERFLNPSSDEAERNTHEQARARVMVYECYLKADVNGDGLLEDAIVTVAGDKLLRAVENPYGRIPFFDLVPFSDSYQVWSKIGLTEIIQDTQDSHTALLRQMLVSLGLSNQYRAVVDQTAIEISDLIDDSMFIRAKGSPQNAFLPLPHPGLNPQNFQFFEYLKSQLEEWTPVTRYNQGLNASSLNKTATGISMIMNASQQRQEEIVRNFAETGIRDLFRFLIRLNQLYLDQPQIVRLQNEALEFSGDDISGDFDLSVDASSGVGAVDAKVQVLTSYLREMFPFALQIGVASPEQFVMAGRKLLQLMGIEDVDKYLATPTPQMMGGMPFGGGEGAGAPIPQVALGRAGSSSLGGVG